MTAADARALKDAATGGKWSWEDDGPFKATLYAGRDDDHHGLNLLGRLDLDSNGHNNLNLIAAAPDLAAEVIRLAAALDEYRRTFPCPRWGTTGDCIGGRCPVCGRAADTGGAR